MCVHVTKKKGKRERKKAAPSFIVNNKHSRHPQHDNNRMQNTFHAINLNKIAM